MAVDVSSHNSWGRWLISRLTRLYTSHFLSIEALRLTYTHGEEACTGYSIAIDKSRRIPERRPSMFASSQLWLLRAISRYIRRLSERVLNKRLNVNHCPRNY